MSWKENARLRAAVTEQTGTRHPALPLLRQAPPSGGRQDAHHRERPEDLALQAMCGTEEPRWIQMI